MDFSGMLYHITGISFETVKSLASVAAVLATAFVALWAYEHIYKFMGDFDEAREKAEEERKKALRMEWEIYKEFKDSAEYDHKSKRDYEKDLYDKRVREIWEEEREFGEICVEEHNFGEGKRTPFLSFEEFREIEGSEDYD